MAVKIRLKRMGKIRQPYYRVVVVDARKKRDGKVIEEIGKYHPKLEPSFIEVTSDRAQYWLGVGAQPSEAVEALLKITGDWQKFKGLPGTEGTLRVAEPKRDKAEIFAEALKDAANEPKSGATTKKAAKKAAAKEEPKAEEPAAEADKAEKPAAKAEKSDAKAEKSAAKAEKSDAKDAPAEAEKSDAKDAPAEEAPAEEPATEATAETTEEAATASTDESTDDTEVEAEADVKSDSETGV